MDVSITGILIVHQIIENKFSCLLILCLSPIKYLNNELVAAVGGVILVDVREDFLVVADWHEVANVSKSLWKFFDEESTTKQFLLRHSSRASITRSIRCLPDHIFAK